MAQSHKTLKVSAPLVVATNRQWLENATIIVKNGIITDIGPTRNLSNVKADKVIKLKEGLISAGLVNAHCHLELSFLAGKLKRRTLFTDWIEDLIAARLKATKITVSTATAKAARRLIEMGVTCVGDVTSSFDVTPVLVKTGLRATVYHETLGYDPGIANEQHNNLISRVSSATCTDLIRLGVSPHAAYSVSGALLKKTTEYAKTKRLPLTVHLCETEDETTFSKFGKGPFSLLHNRRGVFNVSVHGKTPARVMADGNALENALCVHFNYPSRGDIALLKKKGASVVFCPNSNKWFKRKVNHALPKLLKNGIAVGLGTDSLASNTDLDIRAEARQVMKLFPDMPLETVYKMMTTGGAKAMGVDNGLGELKPSSPFDAIHLNINVSGKKSPLHAIIDSRGPVLRSWVAGKEIFNNN